MLKCHILDVNFRNVTPTILQPARDRCTPTNLSTWPDRLIGQSFLADYISCVLWPILDLAKLYISSLLDEIQ